MRRLVYAPSVEVYIRSEEAGEVFDVSKDVISGSVTRRLDAVSNASLTLQNKFGKYTRKIKPMDRIAIFLTRMGKPTLAFTGYVDTSPFYQLVPRPITITASCTLKLIQNTYFDPGLPFMSQWFQRYGWTWDSSTGTLIDPFQGFGNQDRPVLGEKGNVARLISGALIDIGGWPEDHIWVRSIPGKFVDTMTTLMKNQAQQSKNELNELMIRMEKLLGIGISELTGTDTSGDVSYSGNISMEQVAEVAYKAGFRGEPLVTAVAITVPESRLNTNAHNPNGCDDSYGLWQINMVEGRPGCDNLGTARRAEYGISTNEELFNPSVNARAAYSISGGGTNFKPWTTFVAGDHEAHVGAARAAVEKYLAKRAGGAGYDPTGKTKEPAEGTQTQWETKPKKTDKPKGKFVFPIGNFTGGIQDNYGAARPGSTTNGIHGAIDIFAPEGTPLVACVDGKITSVGTGDLGGTDGGGGYRLWINNRYYYAHMDTCTVKEGDTVARGQVIGSVGIKNGSPHLHFGEYPNGWNTSVSYDGGINPFTTLQKALLAGPVGIDVDTTGGISGADSQTLDDQRVAAIARQAAWFTMTLPTVDAVSSMMLTGKRAIQNDITLFDWIQSMVTASGRRFMSMPNGDFMSFFPDYFNLHGRTPYFVIRDIEIIDLTIDVSDRDLTTHLFVSGTSSSPQFSLVDQLQSMFASVQEEAFNVFINTKDAKVKGKKKPTATFEPTKFLQRYGVRPKTIELPEIRHPTLLWMAAWTEFARMWANTFQANATFTFLPELLPGGVVEFDDKITMFVEEVTHSFDMEAGFTTSATLSAPASATNSSAFGSMVLAGGNFGVLDLLKEDKEIQRTVEEKLDPRSPVRVSGGRRGGV